MDTGDTPSDTLTRREAPSGEGLREAEATWHPPEPRADEEQRRALKEDDALAMPLACCANEDDVRPASRLAELLARRGEGFWPLRDDRERRRPRLCDVLWSSGKGSWMGMGSDECSAPSAGGEEGSSAVAVGFFRSVLAATCCKVPTCSDATRCVPALSPQEKRRKLPDLPSRGVLASGDAMARSLSIEKRRRLKVLPVGLRPVGDSRLPPELLGVTARLAFVPLSAEPRRLRAEGVRPDPKMALPVRGDAPSRRQSLGGSDAGFPMALP
mmetsp:Transcript_38675/g.75567  ORF Transcript_38675/g.75567 Transcript_38675/m.75567 type:complete len:270 (+) Transcript_38675:445-1254(+)